MNTLTAIVRFLSILPLLLFFLDLSGRGEQEEDNNVKRVRKVTLLICLGNIILIGQLALMRIIYVQYMTPFDIVSFLISLVILIINFYSYWEYKSIQNR